MTERVHTTSWSLDYAAQEYQVSCTCGWFFRVFNHLDHLEAVAREHLFTWNIRGERADMASLNHSNNNLGAQNMNNARIAELEQALEAAKKEHEAFKRQVAQTAMKYARQHDWCGVVQEALNEVGVDPDAGAKWIRLQVDVKVQMSTGYEHLDAPVKFNNMTDYTRAHGSVNNAGTTHFGIEFNDNDDSDRILELSTHTGEIIDYRVHPRVLSISDEIPAVVTNV